MSHASVSDSASSQQTTTGAQLLVDALVTHGVERVFCVPGESFLAVLDSLHDETKQIETIVCRHEASRASHSSRAAPVRRMRRSACIPRFRTRRR
jgi:acetolactate synthase I/II/III large subunit